MYLPMLQTERNHGQLTTATTDLVIGLMESWFYIWNDLLRLFPIGWQIRKQGLI